MKIKLYNGHNLIIDGGDLYVKNDLENQIKQSIEVKLTILKQENEIFKIIKLLSNILSKKKEKFYYVVTVDLQLMLNIWQRNF